ncbi:hypothetical protein CTRI78_v011418 [Colletotrichum trifolii]|uniref:Transcription factor domain-containing protein n=1 Tax=Colletotrichum trifolii TaxID=5466 RepID=A0A4R8QB05_COLTR|nr:hypothetical protein CTRI78_v011418 [Colletotrichum trifolii]
MLMLSLAFEWLVTTDDALSTILERLQRVEKHCTALPTATQTQGSEEDVPATGSASESTPVHPSARAAASASSSEPLPTPRRHASIPNSVPSNVSSPAPSSAAGGLATSPWTSLATPIAAPELDTAAILKDAVDQVQRLRLQTIATAAITENVRVPPELCRVWIQNYFAHMQTEMFVSLINRKLIELIPDLLELPHVHLDPAILVVYYGILYHGCALSATFTGKDEGFEYVRLLYLCCLRSLPLWQREATGTTTDCIAAIFMCRTAAECFDEELSWRMYTYACEYAQKLNFHNLDAHTADVDPSLLDQTKLDADRKGFWELIQIDFFFRLLFNRPAALTANVNSWKVNLPWLSADAQPDMNAVPTAAFLISSRLTFIVSRFFQELDGPNCTEVSMRPKTEDLCREIFQLYADWQLDGWIQRALNSDNKAEGWVMGDVALTGYTYVIFMLRKLSVLGADSPRPVSSDADVPASPLAVEASRNLLHIVHLLMAKNPYPESMCVLFGMFRLYVSYACLLNNVLRDPDVRSRAADVALIERVTEGMVTSARAERDFVPLIRAIRSLGVEVRKRFNEAGPNGGTPMTGVTLATI